MSAIDDTDPDLHNGDNRSAPRESLFLGTQVTREAQTSQGRIRNLSKTGALLELSPQPGVGEIITLSFRGVDEIGALVVRVTPKGVGVKFAKVIDPQACRLSVTPKDKDWTKDYVLCLREGYRPMRWDNSAPTKRPKLRGE